MPAQRTNVQRTLVKIFRLLFAVMLLTACQSAGAPSSQPSASYSPAPTVPAKSTSLEYPMAEVTFEAQLPEKLADGQGLFIEILDEVTGLALNPSRARMATSDEIYFGVKIPIPVGSVVKYRYVRENDPAGIEYTSDKRQVRYRLFYVDGPGTVRDIVAAWKSTPSTSGLGRIQGQVANKANNSPVVNALVSAGGMQTLTASDGSFILEGLPPGIHNMVIYSLDGAFQPFQQGAAVAVDSTTPALIMLTPTDQVNVTFVARPPKDSPPGIPVRLIGNTYPLGNTFADLHGGMNAIASRSPLMRSLPDGSYSLTLKLPIGLDLRYKYTLGDGFWNAEYSSNGSLRLRQFIVPAKDMTVIDMVDTWKTPGRAPVSFSVTVPENTPDSDVVSIQFNPFGWTQPIPMWPAGKNQWTYTLFNPLNLFNTASYRYCRNDQCGIADADDSRGADAAGKQFSPQANEQSIQDKVNAWAWLEPAQEQVVVPAAQVAPRDNSYQAGVEFMPLYHPSWKPYMPQAFQEIKGIGANTVMLSPTWHLTHQVPPVMAPVTGKDPLWLDVSQMALEAQQKGLSVILHPVLSYGEDPKNWWKNATRDDGWWQSWFDRYRTFLLYHADMAAQSGAEALVIGDETIQPAMPGGKLADGSPSNAPGNTVDRWKKLIAAVRSRYSGKLIWLVPYTIGAPPVDPGFLGEIDFLYVVLSGPLAKPDANGAVNIEASVSAALDADILSLQEKTNHPVLLGLQYPSAQGVFDACVQDPNTVCPGPAVFEQPAPQPLSASVGLKEQAEAYSAVLSVINQRSWITGFFASGYYPPAALIDMSDSVRNKPAGDVLWYYFPRLLNQTTP